MDTELEVAESRGPNPPPQATAVIDEDSRQLELRSAEGLWRLPEEGG